MNHIVRLQTELASAREELAAKRDAIQAFRVHLAGPKFAGFDADGSRRDWIATADGDAWLTRILSAEGDGAPAP